MSELTKEDEYGIISRTMMNIRSLRVFAREIDFEQLLEMQEKLNVVIEERREDARVGSLAAAACHGLRLPL